MILSDEPISHHVPHTSSECGAWYSTNDSSGYSSYGCCCFWYPSVYINACSHDCHIGENVLTNIFNLSPFFGIDSSIYDWSDNDSVKQFNKEKNKKSYEIYISESLSASCTSSNFSLKNEWSTWNSPIVNFCYHLLTYCINRYCKFRWVFFAQRYCVFSQMCQLFYLRFRYSQQF